MLIAPIGLWLDDHPVPGHLRDPADATCPALVFADPTGPLAESCRRPTRPTRSRCSGPRMTMASILQFIWPIPDKGLDRAALPGRRHRRCCVGRPRTGSCTPPTARTFAARLRDARLVTVAGAGHLPQLENPEPVAEAVRGFLDDDGAG